MYKHTILFDLPEQALRFIAEANIERSVLAFAQEGNPNPDEVHLTSLAPLSDEQVADLNHEALCFSGLLYANTIVRM